MKKVAVAIRSLTEFDLTSVESILCEHVRDLYTGEVVESEVQAILGYMQGQSDEFGRVRSYIVACGGSDNVLGCMAISSLDPVMAAHFGEEAAGAAELLNAFVGKAYMGGKGVGAALLKAACELALKSGARNLVVNSGPRYFSNWGFYDRLFEKDCGIILNKYGEGRHAKTWIKRLA